jgi:cytosine/uracil/thiamine/allantoin permease
MATSGAARILSLVASVVRTVCAVIAGVIVVHALFVLFEANPANGLVQFAADWRNSFGWFTRDLFTPSDPKIAEAINAGLAAVVWVVAGSLLSKLVVRLTPTSKATA